MRNKVIYGIICFLLLVLPFNTFAISDDYKDVVSSITGETIQADEVILYLFHGEECPHCEAEREWLKTIRNKYDNIRFVYYEVWHDDTNLNYLQEVFDKLEVDKRSIPFTVIGDKYFIGFSETQKQQIENTLREYLELDSDKDKEIYIPILKNINPKDVSITLVAIILGVIDGFNPCAMWILLFLINMLIYVKDKKRRLILGITFLLTSGLVYFLSMLGISFILDFMIITWIRYLIAVFAIILGIINLFKFIKNNKQEDVGCEVVDDKKRKKIIKKIKKIQKEKSIWLALLGIVTLAVGVNLVEMACSLGFPLIFTEILSLNNIKGLMKIIYLLIYIFFYMFDDILIFVIAMKTLEVTGVTNKYSKYTKLIGGILMLIIGILMIFKYEWLTLNF
ncbi:MAG: hypothetical protein IJ501_02690 [Bacilli bacterium]|nr:hypothetical protein [Bacilli bacterium]